jgi:hypothetical protein
MIRISDVKRSSDSKNQITKIALSTCTLIRTPGGVQPSQDDLSVPEVNKDFTRDFFDNIDLDAALAIPRDGDVPDFTRATARLRDKMDCRLAQLPTAQSCTSECMKSITQMVTKRHKRRSLLLRACARDAQPTRYVRGDHNRNGRIGCEPTGIVHSKTTQG